MSTVAAVKQRALELLRVVEVGQSTESQHDTRIGSAYTEVYNDLKEEGIAVWAEAGTIPDNIVPHLVGLMAWNAIDDYGVSDSLYQRISIKASNAKREIRALVTQKHESLSEPDDF